MRKGDEIFSKDELAMLKDFAKKGVKEDKRLHGITDNKNNITLFIYLIFVIILILL